MNRACCVPSCRANSKDGKVPVFKVPIKPDRLAAWSLAIPRMNRELLSSDGVCAKHFPDHMISTSYHIEYKRRVLLHVPKKPTLTQDAVPCIFPGYATYLPSAKDAKSPRKPPKPRPPPTPRPRKTEPETTAPPSSTLLDDRTVEDPVPEKSNAHTACVPLVPPFSFSALFKDPETVQLPEKTWSFHVVDHDCTQAINFSRLCPHENPLRAHVPLKLLTVSPAPGDGISISTFALGKPMSTGMALQGSQVASVRDLALALEDFDLVELCVGGPTQREDPDVPRECAFVDLRGVWRHHRCTLVATIGDQCIPCNAL